LRFEFWRRSAALYQRAVGNRNSDVGKWRRLTGDTLPMELPAGRVNIPITPLAIGSHA
jgi:hypothetical protein